ncbi:MAG: LysR family transcriptional regulator [Acidithiobacillus sp.]|nr:LysR family transcriptional regulator [Acidithiobacillus sp.]
MERHPIDPSLLLIWAQAARVGNLHQAAERLFLTQPAVSHRLRQLQERVGEPLYRRTHRGISPTPLGIALQRIGEQIEAALAEASDLCKDSQGLLTGTVHIAASQSNAELLLPALLARFQERYPAIDLQVRAVNSRQARQLQEEYDLIFVEDDQPASNHASWQQKVLVETEIGILMPKGHPWCGEERIPLARLEEVNLIWRESGSGIREAVVQACNGLGLSLAIHYEFSGLSAIREAVRQGLGLAFGSCYHRNPGTDLLLLPLEPKVPHRLSVLYRSHSNRATLALLQILTDILNNPTGRKTARGFV